MSTMNQSLNQENRSNTQEDLFLNHLSELLSDYERVDPGGSSPDSTLQARPLPTYNGPSDPQKDDILRSLGVLIRRTSNSASIDTRPSGDTSTASGWRRQAPATTWRGQQRTVNRWTTLTDGTEQQGFGSSQGEQQKNDAAATAKVLVTGDKVTTTAAVPTRPADENETRLVKAQLKVVTAMCNALLAGHHSNKIISDGLVVDEMLDLQTAVNALVSQSVMRVPEI